MSRVKNSEEIVFLFFFSDFFRILSEFFFRLSAKNLQKVVKTTFCVSRGTICGLKSFLIVLNRFGFSAETFGNGSQISIYVSRVKIAEKTIFLFFFSEFFRFLTEKFFRLSVKKLQKVVKTTFYVSRGKVCGLNFFF